MGTTRGFKRYICMTFAALSACASEPQVERATPALAMSDLPTIMDPAGNPYPENKVRELIRKVSGSKHEVMVTELSKVIEDITRQPLVAGNAVKPLIDGPATFDAMFKAIDNARHHIHMETFILDNDEVGRKLADRLLERRKAGVEVRVVYDAFGSRNLDEHFIEELENAGIQLYKYHPIDPTEDLRIWRTNNRNHRKLMIVDGRVAFTGGINISEVYAESSLSISARKRGKEPEPDEGWRDTHAQIEGPVVHQFQRLFLRLWHEQELDAKVEGEKYYPDIEPAGDYLVRAVASRGGDDEYAIYTVILAAVAHARERIWVTQAYFAPNDALVEALRDAAKRGVDVRLLLPGISDAPLVLQASRSDYATLLEAGVRIFERRGTTLHAKTMVIDGVWSSIGSANLDYRSFLHNHELNAVIVSGELGQAMEKMFDVDLQQAEEIKLSEWRDRPLMDRAKEFVGSMLRYWF